MGNNEYLVDVSGLLDLQGSDFIKESYLKVFGRPVDEGAYSVLIKEVEKKDFNRSLYLIRLLGAEEIRKKGVRVTGFNRINVQWLLDFDDEEFVKNSYAIIKNKLIDEKEQRDIVIELRSGTATKYEIVKKLYSDLLMNDGSKLIIEDIDEKGASISNDSEDEEILSQEDSKKTIKHTGKKYLKKELEKILDDNYASRKEFINEINKVKRVIRSNVIHDYDANGKINEQLSRQLEEIKLLREENLTLINRIDEFKKQNDSFIIELSNLRSRISNIKNDCKSLNSKPDINSEESAANEDNKVVNSSDSYTVIDYFDFENHFRGSIDHVKKVQEIYIPYFAGRKNVLDLGCGRGEFTQLLTEHGVGVTGVDMYGPYVEYMKMKNLPVVLDDAVNYLRRQEHTDGIFMGQVIEHISIEQIIEILELAYEKLETGSYLIMETPNPMSLAIFTHSFYIDPSHQKPLHPETMKYLARKAGFNDVEVLFTESSKYPVDIPKINDNDPQFDKFNEAMKVVSETLFGSQDYALVVKK